MFSSSREDPERRARKAEVKAWAAELLAAQPEDTILVTELQCTEPGCPPIETVIALMRPGVQQKLKVHKALSDIRREDLEQALHGHCDAPDSATAQGA
jgi:hypothetical protein